MATASNFNYGGWTKQSATPIYDGEYPDSLRSGGAFQLPVGNYIPARMSLNTVYPRPDSETQAHARHRLMHTVMDYEIPIGVQGGAWPFKYELTTSPSGALIGELHGNASYGVLTCPPQSSGTHNFTVKVTDQEGSTVNISWSAVVDDTKFTFIADGYTGTSTGTVTQPLKLLSDWYLGDSTDSTYANQVMVLRGGSYGLVGDTAQGGNVEMNTGIKTPTLIAYPSETPIVNCSTAKIFSRGGTNLLDFYIAGIRWESARQDVSNAHIFWVTGTTGRATWYDNYFYDFGAGTSGTDNNTAIFVSDRVSEKDYYLIKNNTWDDFHNASSNGSYLDMYDSSNVLVEGNTAKNSGNTYGWWMKGTIQNVTVRANEAYDNITNGGITVGYGAAARVVPHDHEVCWNRIVLPTGNNTPHTIQWANQDPYTGSFYNSYLYRNTFINASAWIRFLGAENYETDGNVVVNNLQARWNTSIMTTVIANITGSETDGITDTTGLLSGVSRTTYLGKAGHEVSA